MPILVTNLIRKFSLHPSYHFVMWRVGGFLSLLASIQLIAWLLQPFFDVSGIPNYLSLHVLLETASIVIAMMVFSAGWNTHSPNLPGNIVLLGCLFLGIGLLDFSHTIAYQGMPVFYTENDADKQLNFWLSGRFLAALALFLVAVRPWQQLTREKIRYILLAAMIGLVILINWLVLFHQEDLPRTFIPGVGLTPLKKGVEYFIIAINIITALILWSKMRTPQRFNVPLLFGAVCAMGMGEFFFTLYTTMTGGYNVLGHVYKVISYIFIYRAIVIETIERPYVELRESAQNYRDLADNGQALIWTAGTDKLCNYFNKVWLAFTGRTLEQEMGNGWAEGVHPDDMQRCLEIYIAAFDRHEYFKMDYRLRHNSGEYRWIEDRGTPRFDAQGTFVGYIGHCLDIDERYKAEETYRRLSTAVEQSPSSVVITNVDGNIEYVNNAFVLATGYSASEAIGKNPRILKSGKTPNSVYQDLWAHLKSTETWVGELTNKRKDGTEYIESVIISPVQDSAGNTINYLAVKTDITDKKLAEERIEKLAHFDALTGLPNRNLLLDRFNYAASLAHRNKEQMAVMFLDIDHFKHINDSLGHSMGDRLLQELARRLKENLREGDTISRMGGDEFILVLPNTNANGAVQVASQLIEVVSKSYAIDMHELIVTASIGIALYPDDALDFETLSKNADAAMYRVKKSGRNGYHFYTSELNERSSRTLQLSIALRSALRNNELHLLYQPQLSIDDGHVIGAEALLRWNHPELGAISPVEFISLAEESGQIIPIGEWVIRTAAQQMKDWIEGGLTPMIMAVNISSVQFRQAGISKKVTSILDEVGLPHECFEMELTEAVAMDDPEGAIAIMDALYDCNIQMSVDDFGTGYSSLNYLKKFKVYKLKIDQSFVRDVTHNSEDKAIVTAIINMASGLGIKTIAEGVETAAQLSFLRMQGCDEV